MEFLQQNAKNPFALYLFVLPLDLCLLQCDLFIQEGARLGRTPAEVVSTCDITFACVSDPKAAKDVRISSYFTSAG